MRSGRDGMPEGRSRERGAVLVEFGFIALLMYLLVAVTVDFGRLFFTAQTVQDAARSSARELSVIPLPPAITFAQAMADADVRARVFQPEHLVIDLDAIPGGLTLDDFFATLPVLNQMLRSLMIFEEFGGRRLLRYPGALISAGTGTGLSVAIPFVESRDGNGIETIRWVDVIEEITHPLFGGVFSLNSPSPQRGLVAIRINYPYQASMMSAYLPTGQPIGTPNLSNRVQADDGSVVQLNVPPGTPVGASGPGVYTGPYGLGQFFVAGEAVRPFRRLISAQMIFRREVFE